MGLVSSLKKGFKKVGKGIKSAFKSIGKGIKSAVGKIGKFMGKIGIVGQLALMFTPLGPMVNSMFASIGSAVGGAFSAAVGQTAAQATAQAAAQQAAVTAGAQVGASAAAVEAGKVAASQLAKGVANKTLTKTVVDGVVSYASKATGLLGSGNPLVRGAGTVLKAAGNFAKAGHSAFKTITDGVSSFVSEFSKTALKKIPGMQNIMPKNFLGDGVSDNFFSGEGSAWSKVQGVVSDNANAALNSFNEAIGYEPTTAQVKVPAPKVASENKQVNYDDKGFRTDLSDSDYNSYRSKQIQTEIDAGRSNFTASTSDYVPDQTALTGKQMVAESGGIQIDKPTFEKQQSLLSQGIDKVTTSYDKWKGDRTFGEALVETGIDKVQDELAGIPDDLAAGVKTRIYQGIGLEAKPEYVTNQYSAYVPTIDTARAGQYASAEINDRAMQIQLTGSQFYMQNPYGFGAQEYLNDMKISTGGTA